MARINRKVELGNTKEQATGKAPVGKVEDFTDEFESTGGNRGAGGAGGGRGSNREQAKATLAKRLVESGLHYALDFTARQKGHDESIAERLLKGEKIEIKSFKQSFSIVDGNMRTLSCPLCNGGNGLHGSPSQGKSLGDKDVANWNAKRLGINKLFYLDSQVGNLKPKQLFSISDSCITKYLSEHKDKIQNADPIQGLMDVKKGVNQPTPAPASEQPVPAKGKAKK